MPARFPGLWRRSLHFRARPSSAARGRNDEVSHFHVRTGERIVTTDSKTFILLAGLMALFLALGQLLGGS
ncbi:MAG TPA: hypothetical protein VF187_09835, partial [Gemmatimonadales bacterium]